MKIVVAQFQQETNTFSAAVTGLDMFKNGYYAYGSELYKEMNYKSTEIGGALTALKEENVEIIPSIATQACSGGPVTKDAYKHIMYRLMEDIDKNMPIDGIYVCLHGAMVLEDEDDGSGKVLEELREKVGDRVVIGASLDYHANVTKKMVENADILLGYQTYPHVDHFNIGYKTAKLMLKTLNKEITPKMVMYKLPMINQAEGSQTTKGPMVKVVKLAKQIEKQQEILSVSYFQMQPWYDVEEAGCSIIVISNNNDSFGKKQGEKLARLYWSIREELQVTIPSLDDLVETARISNSFVVFSDTADAPGAGSTGDSTEVLEYLIENKITFIAYINIVDSETVNKAIELGIGNVGEFSIGGKIDKERFSPVKINGKVKHISDGTFVMEGPQFNGKEFNMGKTVVIKKDNIFIVVMEQATLNWDPGLYKSVGLEPLNAKLVMTKSPNGFKAAYKGLTEQMMLVDTKGASMSYFWKLPFKKIKKPMYPFDKEVEYIPKAYMNKMEG